MENYTFDLQRIFFGDVPILFLFEIALRTTIMLGYTLLLIRLLGKRGLSHLSLFEVVLILALGSAVGDPMLYPNIPVIHGMVVITTVVALQRLLVWVTNRSVKAEKVLEGKPEPLIFDGRFELDALKKSAMSRNEIYMQLRLAQIEQLGQVKCSYQEVNGEISVFMFDKDHARPGLSVLPQDADAELPAGAVVDKAGDYACLYCGHVVTLESGQTLPNCPECDHEHWAEANRSGVRH